MAGVGVAVCARLTERRGNNAARAFAATLEDESVALSFQTPLYWTRLKPWGQCTEATKPLRKIHLEICTLVFRCQRAAKGGFGSLRGCSSLPGQPLWLYHSGLPRELVQVSRSAANEARVAALAHGLPPNPLERILHRRSPPPSPMEPTRWSTITIGSPPDTGEYTDFLQDEPAPGFCMIRFAKHSRGNRMFELAPCARNRSS
jgi:hypothetical protein